MSTALIRESRAFVAEAVDGKPGQFDIGIITPGWGSSGYYSADVLEKAATDTVFPAGTHMYLDHPSESESQDRPERSIRDIGAVLAEDAYWDGSTLRAKANVIGPYRDLLEQLAPSIGVSIRASAEVSEGTADGRKGRIVDRLVEGASVDFVTRAGRGGSILNVFESARVARRAVARGIAEATANDTRDAIQSALSDRFGGVDADSPWVWLRDFDDTTAWYAINDQTYQIGYTLSDDNQATLASGDPIEVNAKTTYVPVGSADGGTTTSESLEDNVAKIEIDEAEHRRLTEASTKLAAETARADGEKKRADTAEAKNAQTDARADASQRAEKLLEKADLSDVAKGRVLETVLAGLPMSDGKLDVAAFEARVTERATSEATYEAALLAERGAGRPSGLGGGPGNDGTGDGTGDKPAITVEAYEAKAARVFNRPTLVKGA